VATAEAFARNPGPALAARDVRLRQRDHAAMRPNTAHDAPARPIGAGPAVRLPAG